MVIIFIYYLAQPFAVIMCVHHVTICRVGLYVDFYKITILGLFFFSRLMCEIGLYAGIYGICFLRQAIRILGYFHDNFAAKSVI